MRAPHFPVFQTDYPLVELDSYEAQALIADLRAQERGPKQKPEGEADGQAADQDHQQSR